MDKTKNSLNSLNSEDPSRNTDVQRTVQGEVQGNSQAVSSTLPNADSDAPKKAHLTADNVSTMMSFFSSKIAPTEDESHKQKITNLLNSYVLAPQYELIRNTLDLGDEPQAEEPSEPEKHTLEDNGKYNQPHPQDTDALLSSYLQTPEQVSFTSLLPAQSFFGMTHILNIAPSNQGHAHARAGHPNHRPSRPIDSAQDTKQGQATVSGNHAHKAHAASNVDANVGANSATNAAQASLNQANHLGQAQSHTSAQGQFATNGSKNLVKGESLNGELLHDASLNSDGLNGDGLNGAADAFNKAHVGHDNDDTHAAYDANTDSLISAQDASLMQGDTTALDEDDFDSSAIAPPPILESLGLEHILSGQEQMFLNPTSTKDTSNLSLYEALKADTVQTTCVDGVCSVDMNDEQDTAPVLDLSLFDGLGELDDEMQLATESNGTELTEPLTDMLSEPLTEPLTEALTEPLSEELTEPLTEPLTDSLTETANSATTEPLTDSLLDVLDGDASANGSATNANGSAIVNAANTTHGANGTKDSANLSVNSAADAVTATNGANAGNSSSGHSSHFNTGNASAAQNVDALSELLDSSLSDDDLEKIHVHRQAHGKNKSKVPANLKVSNETTASDGSHPQNRNDVAYFNPNLRPGKTTPPRKVNIPPVPTSTRYSQVSTDDLIDQFDPLALIYPKSHLDLFKDQSALSHASTYTLVETLNTIKVPTQPKLYAEFGDMPDLLSSEELISTLNYMIKSHDRYRNNLHPELLSCVGYWCFDREEGGFSIDQAAGFLLGIEDYNRVITTAELYKLFTPHHVDKIIYNHENADAGMIFSDRLTLTSGPYAGVTLIAQGSALLRDPVTGQVLLSSGFICYESCPQAEFVFREISGDGMFVWTPDNDHVESSASYHSFIGYSKEEYPSTFTEFCEKLVHPDDYDALLIQQHVVKSPAYGNYFETCIRLKHKNGNYIWTIGRGLVLERNEKGLATKVVGTQSDINLVHSSFETINSLMFTDSLTELHNRSYFTQNAVRYEQQSHYPMSILFVDVTGLKLTNDILGHNFGDYLILKCAIGLMQGLQTTLAKTHLYPELREKLSDTIDDLTRKAFLQIYQEQEQIDKAEKMFTEANDRTRATYPEVNLSSVASFATNEETDNNTLKLQSDTIQQMLNHKMLPEIIRLAGDELLLLFPSCSVELAYKVKMEFISACRKMNALDRLSFPSDQRPVPLCFGVGVATVGENGPNDTFKQALERADMQMLANKEAYQEANHKTLKTYFEQRLKREVSMRDNRREEILSQKERQALQKQPRPQSGDHTAHKAHTNFSGTTEKGKPELKLCD